MKKQIPRRCLHARFVDLKSCCLEIHSRSSASMKEDGVLVWPTDIRCEVIRREITSLSVVASQPMLPNTMQWEQLHGQCLNDYQY